MTDRIADQTYRQVGWTTPHDQTLGWQLHSFAAHDEDIETEGTYCADGLCLPVFVKEGD